MGEGIAATAARRVWRGCGVRRGKGSPLSMWGASAGMWGWGTGTWSACSMVRGSGLMGASGIARRPPRWGRSGRNRGVGPGDVVAALVSVGDMQALPMGRGWGEKLARLLVGEEGTCESMASSTGRG